MRWTFVAALSVGCAAGERGGLVILDPAARERGIEVVIDGEPMSQVLPVRVDGPFEIRSDSEDLSMDIEAGVVAFVGADGFDFGFLGTDIDPDEATIAGDPDALQQLADDLEDVDVSIDGDTATVTGIDALWALADAAEPEGLEGLWTVDLERFFGSRASRSKRIVLEVPADVAVPRASAGPPADGANPGRWEQWSSWIHGLLGSAPAPEVVDANPDLVPFVGYYSLGSQEIALGLDGRVREAAGDGAPTGTWTLDASGAPSVIVDEELVPVTRTGPKP
jgi:hypothetical protein